MMRSWLSLILRLSIATVFFYAAFSKLLDVDSFMEKIKQHQAISHAATPFVALFIPSLEIVLTIGLFTPHWRTEANAGLIFLITFFSFLLGIGWFNGTIASCGCFGNKWMEMPISIALLRNGFILSLLVLIYLNDRDKSLKKMIKS